MTGSLLCWMYVQCHRIIVLFKLASQTVLYSYLLVLILRFSFISHLVSNTWCLCGEQYFCGSAILMDSFHFIVSSLTIDIQNLQLSNINIPLIIVVNERLVLYISTMTSHTYINCLPVPTSQTSGRLIICTDVIYFVYLCWYTCDKSSYSRLRSRNEIFILIIIFLIPSTNLFRHLSFPASIYASIHPCIYPCTHPLHNNINNTTTTTTTTNNNNNDVTTDSLFLQKRSRIILPELYTMHVIQYDISIS